MKRDVEGKLEAGGCHSPPSAKTGLGHTVYEVWAILFLCHVWITQLNS